MSGSTNENWVTGHVHSYSRTSSRLGVSCARTRAYTCKWPRIYVYTRFVTSFHPLPHPGCQSSCIWKRARRRVSATKFLPRYHLTWVRSRSNFKTELDLNGSLIPTRIFDNGISWLVRSARNSFNLYPTQRLFPPLPLLDALIEFFLKSVSYFLRRTIYLIESYLIF